MTLILKRSSLAKDFITGGQDNVGLRVPAHPIAMELLKRFGEIGGLGVAAPSANRFGAVSPTSAPDVLEELVDSSFEKINFFTELKTPFQKSPIPETPAEYRAYKAATLRFVAARNSRISNWTRI